MEVHFVNRTYINVYYKQTMEKKRRRNLRVGLGFAIFFGLGILMAVTNPSAELKKHLSIYIGCFALSLIPLYLAFTKSQKLGSINRYDAIFLHDRDGFVSTYELAQQLGKEESVILQELEKYYREGIFVDSTLYREGRPGVQLGDLVHVDKDQGFINVVCGACGATNRVQVNAVSECSYCGSRIVGTL